MATVGFLTTRGPRRLDRDHEPRGPLCRSGRRTRCRTWSDQQARPAGPAAAGTGDRRAHRPQGRRSWSRWTRTGARTAIRELVAAGAQAIAVSLLWSFRNDAHERRVGELIAEEAPGLYVGAVVRRQPAHPGVRPQRHHDHEHPGRPPPARLPAAARGRAARARLRRLAAGHAGFRRLRRFQGRAVARDHHHRVGAHRRAWSAAPGWPSRLGHRNVISTDMGGTTFLAGLVVDGEPVSTTSTVLNQYALNVPMVDVHTIGAGGGAIAWVDAGRNLRVGPRSAGARPGPGLLRRRRHRADRHRRRPAARASSTRTTSSAGARRCPRSSPPRRYAPTSPSRSGCPSTTPPPRSTRSRTPRPPTWSARSSSPPARIRATSSSTPSVAPGRCTAPATPPTSRSPRSSSRSGPTAAVFSAYGLAASDIVLTAELSSPANFPTAGRAVQRRVRSAAGRTRRRLADQRLNFASVDYRNEADLRYTMQLAEVATPVPDGDRGRGRPGRRRRRLRRTVRAPVRQGIRVRRGRSAADHLPHPGRRGAADPPAAG